MNAGKAFIYLCIFLAGFLSCAFIGFLYSEVEKPLILGSFSLVSSGLNAPGDWLKESQVHVYDNAIVIDIKGASLAQYAPTGSMKPVLNQDSNGIRIVPSSEEQIKTGDIITFEQDGQLIVHRVVQKGKDEQGTYFITKGDNNNITDGKVRFKDVKYVTIGILW